MSRRRALTLVALFLLVLFIVGALSLSVGSVPVGIARVLKLVFSSEVATPVEWTILMELRLPRILLAALTGAALSVAGAVLQALLRNPLADPFILGISSGSALGAVVAFAAGVNLTLFGYQGVSLLAFAGGLVSLGCLLLLARVRGGFNTVSLILVGVSMSAFFGAVLMLFVTLSPEIFQRGALSWLMGDLALVNLTGVWPIVFYFLIALVPIYYYSRGLNLLTLGEEAAYQLGLDVDRVKTRLLVAVSLLTASVVSIAGVIGFVGLVVPHGVRMAFGPDHRLLVPLSAVAGATFLVGADLVARVALEPAEIPVGVVTALIGAPFFIYLLRRTMGRWLYL